MTTAPEAAKEEQLMEHLAEAAAATEADEIAKRETLLAGMLDAVRGADLKMDFKTAMMAAERIHARLQLDRQIYEYYHKVVQGEAALNDFSQHTDVTDGQGRPVVAKIPLMEILSEEIVDDKERAKLVNSLAGAINNYFAKRISTWVRQHAVLTTIAAAKMGT